MGDDFSQGISSDDERPPEARPAYDAKDQRIHELEEALRMIAGRKTEDTGHTYGSTLHDVRKMGRFAGRVLDGENPYEAIDEV